MNDDTSEHGQQPRGVFDVDEERALDALRLEWGDAYDVGFEAGAWLALSRDHGRRVLTGQTPDELAAALRADWAREGTL
jgi:hypothetical protein